MDFDNKRSYDLFKINGKKVCVMTFSEQLNKYRKEAKMTQEELAEKCDVTRQAVAKWESGESIPDVYKISQIAGIFNISLEKLVWGEDKDGSAKVIAKDIYMQFIENLEELKYVMKSSSYSTKPSNATKLRTTIKKARVVFPKRIVDELYALTEDFGIYSGSIIEKEVYKDYFRDETKTTHQKELIYALEIVPIFYEKVETLLEDYLDLPK